MWPRLKGHWVPHLPFSWEPPAPPWGPLTFNPRHLTVAEGETATFTCSFSNTSTNFVLNWYRMSPRNQMDKLAAFPEDSSQPGRDQRFRVTQLPNGRDFRMSVLTARQNDSGIYLCGAIHLFPDTEINESPHANLTVTERVPEPPTEGPSSPTSPAGQMQGLVIGVTSILVGVLLLLLLTWALATAFPRAMRGNVLKQGPSPGPVFSVYYGELDFQWREKTPEPPAPCVPEQTEYATIVFPGSPASPSRRASADSPQRAQPVRPEDGHCSWPL
uniref:Programmed cell death 1 n=1 Tax=Rhinolophus ferrumequinum TaxID=59479 RepID=A0A671DJF2_RHIFE